MKKKTLAGIIIFAVLGYAHTAASSQEKCIDALNRINQEYSLRLNMNIAADILKNLDANGWLPNNFVTEKYAINTCGWLPNSGQYIWGFNACNKRFFGGDPYTNANHNVLPQGRWFTADLKYLGSWRYPQRLIYSPDTKVRFITPDLYRSFIKIPDCTTKD